MPKQHTTYSLFAFIFCLCFSSKIIAQEGVVTINQDRDIDRLLELKKEVNRSDLNYTIRVFRGNRNDTEEAYNTYKMLFEDWKVTLNYNNPRYEVWIGNFKTRLQADRELATIKDTCNMTFKDEPELKKACRAAFILKPKPKKEERPEKE